MGQALEVKSRVLRDAKRQLPSEELRLVPAACPTAGLSLFLIPALPESQSLGQSQATRFRQADRMGPAPSSATRVKVSGGRCKACNVAWSLERCGFLMPFARTLWGNPLFLFDSILFWGRCKDRDVSNLFKKDVFGESSPPPACPSWGTITVAARTERGGAHSTQRLTWQVALARVRPALRSPPSWAGSFQEQDSVCAFLHALPCLLSAPFTPSLPAHENFLVGHRADAWKPERWEEATMTPLTSAVTAMLPRPGDTSHASHAFVSSS